MPKILKNLIPQIIVMIVVSVIYSGLGIWILSFINSNLLTLKEQNNAVILSFFALLALYLLFSILSRIALSFIENDFIFRLRTSIIKRIIDTPNEKINAIGRSNLLASLSSDVSNLTQGFMRISEIVQGLFVVAFSSFYILYVSYEIFIFLLIWMSAGVIISLIATKQIYKHYDSFRQGEDALYKNYQTGIEGHKELSLNIKKAQNLYENSFVPNAKALRQNAVKAEVFGSFASNWMNVVMMGAIGAVLYICLGFGAASLQDGVTISLAILFLRAPLMMLLFALPSLLKAQIALKKLRALDLAEHEIEFKLSADVPTCWKQLRLENINFSYDGGFGLKDINLEINRGECVFLIGQNGSGKSTLFMLIAGLLQAKSGQIWLDNIPINRSNLRAYSNSISAIFSDFYLFDEVGSDELNLAQELLKKMFLDAKVTINDGKFSTLNLSQGQKKRLAMVVALLEKRKFLMLDEWAADQDPEFRRFFYEQFLDELKSLGYTIFAISHDDSYFKYADKIYEIKDGMLNQIK